jgi:hypothetical protein
MSVTPAPVAGPPSRPGAAVCGALALTIAQVVAVFLASGIADFGAAYRALHHWDSTWYTRIATAGYPADLPRERERMAEVGFFPGYPLWARAVARATGLPAETATLAAAQLAGVGFWAYVLLFLRRGRVPAPLALATVLPLAAHPSAFFLTAGYSESLFLGAALGFLYWSAVRGPGGWLLAALHGAVMTATRIVGLPLAACPLLLAAAALAGGERCWREVVRAALLCGAASLGAALFFAFCQWQYGRWDAYMYAQAAGWGVKPDYLALFKGFAYRPGALLFGDDGTVVPNALSRWAVPLTVLLSGGVLLAELRWGRGTSVEGRRERAGLMLAAGLMFYVAASGLAGSGFVSMVRYTFCAHVALAVAAACLLAQLPTVRARAWWVALLIVPVVASAVVQRMLIRLFTHGEWVA